MPTRPFALEARRRRGLRGLRRGADPYPTTALAHGPTTARNAAACVRSRASGPGTPQAGRSGPVAPGDWAPSNTKIKGAIREDPPKVSSWMEKYPKDKTLVFYCS